MPKTTKSVNIDYNLAKKTIEEEVEKAKSENISGIWVDRTKKISELCNGKNLTFIAMLGTALLARSTNILANPLALKSSTDLEGAYSARGLAKEVLAPLALKFDFNIGVSGREPLNNQPFFSKTCVDNSLIPIVKNRKAFDFLLELLEEIAKIDTEEKAKEALRCFIFARLITDKKREFSSNHKISDVLSLVELIENFVSINGENGKRSQAVVAGLLDTLTYTSENIDRIKVGRINDPDRHFPGDVGILKITIENTVIVSEDIDISFEVRDKKVEEMDIYNIIQKASENNIKKIGIISSAKNQENFDIKEVTDWGKERGVMFVFYVGWKNITQDSIFFSLLSLNEALRKACESIFKRSQEIEVSSEGIEFWINGT